MRRNHCSDAAACCLPRDASPSSRARAGWLDADWKWSALYDTLNGCGKPTDALATGGPTVYTRKYDHCTVTVDCTDVKACTAKIDGPHY